MNQFVELKVTVKSAEGLPRMIKRMININEILSISEQPHGKCIVFTKEHPQPPHPKHSKNKNPSYPLYRNALVLPTTIDNDYNDLRKELAGKSILEPDTLNLKSGDIVSYPAKKI